MEVAHPNVNPTLGPLLVSLLVSTFLFGVSSVQGYLYQTNFPNDNANLKVMVLAVWLCELAHSICVCDSFYTVAILSWGNIEAFTELPHSFIASIALSGVIGTIVQRLKIISGQRVIAAFCWFLSAIRAGLVMTTSIVAWRSVTLERFDSKWKWLCVLTVALGAATDFMLAVLLCFYLKVAQRTSDHASTALRINKIVIWTIQTGLLTGFTELSILISFLTAPNDFTWLGIYTFLVRLFSNSLFASLNGRMILREGKYQAQYAYKRYRDNNSPNAVAIQVTKMVEVKKDPLYEYGII